MSLAHTSLPGKEVSRHKTGTAMYLPLPKKQKAHTAEREKGVGGGGAESAHAFPHSSERV